MKRKKLLTYFVLLLAALISTFIILTSFIPKVEQENRFIVSPGLKLEVYNTFRKLPNYYRDKILEENWTIELLDSTIEENLDLDIEEDIAGLTNVKNRTIYIEAPEVLLHELCHACLFNVDTNSSFYIFYDEMTDEMKKTKMNLYCRSEKDEYVVQCMAEYLEDRSCLNNLPATKAAVEEMLSDRNWRKDYE